MTCIKGKANSKSRPGITFKKADFMAAMQGIMICYVPLSMTKYWILGSTKSNNYIKSLLFSLVVIVVVVAIV